MPASVSMLSSFFNERGVVYFYDLNNPAAHEEIEGDYTIVQRHEYGAPPSTLPRCLLNPGTCLSCPAHHKNDDKTDTVKTFLPVDERSIYVWLKSVSPEMDIRIITHINFKYNGFARDANRITLYPCKFQGDSRMPNLQLGIQFASNKPAKDLRDFWDKTRPYGVSETDEKMRRIIMDPIALRSSGSTVTFGFVIDRDFTRKMLQDDDRNSKSLWGFQFAQFELSVRVPDTDDTGLHATGSFSYHREVVIAIKVPDESSDRRVADHYILTQELEGMTKFWAIELRSAMDNQFIVPARYAVKRLERRTSSIQNKMQAKEFPIYEDPPEGYTMENDSDPEENTSSDIPAAQNWVEPGLEEIGIRIDDRKFSAGNLEVWLKDKEYNNLTTELEQLSKFLSRFVDWAENKVQAEHEREDAREQNTRGSLFVLKDAQAYVANRLEGVKLERKWRERAFHFGGDGRGIAFAKSKDSLTQKKKFTFTLTPKDQAHRLGKFNKMSVANLAGTSRDGGAKLEVSGVGLNMGLRVVEPKLKSDGAVDSMNDAEFEMVDESKDSGVSSDMEVEYGSSQAERMPLD